MSGRKENKTKQAKVYTSQFKFVNAPVIDECLLTLKRKVAEMQKILGEIHVVDEVMNASL